MVYDRKALLDFVGGMVFSFLGIVTFASYMGYPFAFVPSWLSFLYSTLLVKVSLIIGGLMLFVSSFSMSRGNLGGSLKPVIFGLLLAFIGALPLLNDYNMLGFLFANITFTVPNAVLSALLACYGFYLLYVAYKVRQKNRLKYDFYNQN